MIRYNQSYGYSKKYQEVATEVVSHQNQRQQINDKTKKLCIENKKRRRYASLHWPLFLLINLKRFAPVE